MDLKKENVTLKMTMEQMPRKVMDQKVNDADRYSRRNNLHIYGVAEQQEENVKEKVKEICCAVVTGSEKATIGAAVDVAHRIGRMESGGKRKFPRPVIVRFTSRSARDAFWKGSKNNGFLRNEGYQVKEDLTVDDRATCACLWPLIEEARKKGERAFLVGNKAFVNGKEVKVG